MTTSSPAPSEPNSSPGAAEPLPDRGPSGVSERQGRVAFVVLAVAAGILMLQYLQAVLLPFIVSFLLFHALDGLVVLLERIRVPRVAGAALVLLLTVGGVGTLGYVLQGQAMAFVNQLPEGARNLARAIESSPNDEPGPLDKVQEAADTLYESAGDSPATPGVMRVRVEEPGFQAERYIWDNSTTALSALNQTMLVLFLTYFMLLSGELFRRKLVKLAGPTLQKRRVTLEIIETIAHRIRQFLMIQIATSAIVAVATWLALWALGLEQAALWGVVAGVLNSVPYYGPLIVTTGLAAVGFLQFGDIGQAALVAGASLLITTIEGSFITPQLVGRAAEMNTLAVFAGLTFWTWAWGVWGLLLAVPMMMVVKVVCDHVEDLKPVAHLLGK
jgi:predicted PurR-regulated permease PerM